jgi:Peptidyl-tRNA hydrolase
MESRRRPYDGSSLDYRQLSIIDLSTSADQPSGSAHTAVRASSGQRSRRGGWQLVVIHDELDFPFGTIRLKRYGGDKLKRGGGDNRHKGLRSMTASVGTREVGSFAHRRFGGRE